MPDRLRHLCAAIILVGVIGGAWTGLYEGGRGGQLAALALAACLPAAAALSPRYPRALTIGGLIAGLLVVGALAADRSVWSIIGLSGDAWAAVGRVIPDGLVASSSSAVPASPLDDADFVGLLDVAFAALAGGVAWQLTARQRPGSAVVLAGLGLAYRWTVAAPANPAWSGSLALAALLAALALGGRPAASRRPGWAARAAGAGLAAMLGAALLAPGAVTQDRGWWDWRTWSLTGGDGPSSGLDIRQTYGQLDWPARPRVVMRVRSPQRLPMRAAVLSEFDGAAFSQSVDAAPSVPLPVDGGLIDVAPAGPGADPVAQVVRFAAFRSSLVLSGGRPLAIRSSFRGTAELREGETVQVDPSLGPGTSYVAFVSVNDPTPSAIISNTTYEPGEVPDEGLTSIRPGFGSAAVYVPVWGTGASPPSDAALGDYARVRRLALQVVGDARSPYVAVNRIESYLRTTYAYDEAPPFPNGNLPLVDFLFTSRRGFCQHFAGAMALMLRSLGIPSRVAVGYTPGRLDPGSDEYVILDRDAHSWVEVLLPQAGWVDFDPTPGRAVANRASVSSPNYAPPPAPDPARPEVAQQPVAPPSDTPATPQRPRNEPAPTPADPGAPAGRDRLPVDPWAAAAVAVLLGLMAPGAMRAVRRVRARRRGDERARVLGAVRDLEDALSRAGLAPPEHGDARERAEWLRLRAGLDAAALYRLAGAARYGPGEPDAGSGRTAWSEARRLRRDARRRTRWPRRAAAYLGMPGPRRDTLAT